MDIIQSVMEKNAESAMADNVDVPLEEEQRRARRIIREIVVYLGSIFAIGVVMFLGIRTWIRK
jgi:hypothetical protein